MVAGRRPDPVAAACHPIPGGIERIQLPTGHTSSARSIVGARRIELAFGDTSSARPIVGAERIELGPVRSSAVSFDLAPTQGFDRLAG